MANVSSEAPPPLHLSPNSEFPDLNRERANISVLEKMKNYIAVAMIYWNGMIRIAASSPPMPKVEKLEIIIAVGIVYLEWMIHTIRKSITAPSTISIAVAVPRRMGQHELHPTQGLFFLTSCCFGLAGANLFILWLWGTDHFTPTKFFVHLVYAVLAAYCATVEFYDMTIGGVGHLFPFEHFPLIISSVILTLLFLEIIWGIFKKSIPISSIAAEAAPLESIKVVRSNRDASTSNPPPANIIPNAAAAGTVRQRGGSSSSDSNSTSSNDAATKTEGSTDTAAKTKAKAGKKKN